MMDWSRVDYFDVFISCLNDKETNSSTALLAWGWVHFINRFILSERFLQDTKSYFKCHSQWRHMINWQNVKCFVLVELYPTIHCSGLSTHQCISEIPEMTVNRCKTAEWCNIKDRGWIQSLSRCRFDCSTVNRLHTFNFLMSKYSISIWTIYSWAWVRWFSSQPQHNSNSFGLCHMILL